MSQGKSNQSVMATGQLAADVGAADFLGSQPHEIERLLAGSAIADDGHEVRQADRVLPRIMQSRHVSVGEILRHGERRRSRRNLGQGDGPEILLQMAQQRIAKLLAEHHPTRDHSPIDLPIGGHPQEQANMGDPANLIKTDRDGLHIDDRHAAADRVELVRG